MKIYLSCLWAKGNKRRIFKFSEYESLAKVYRDRISAFVPCEVTHQHPSFESRAGTSHLWICDRSSDAKILSSEMLADKLSNTMTQTVKELWIGIGGPDGFTKQELGVWKPQLKWSFGPLTLPHELASVIALEQLYRALSIQNHHPYHLQH